MRTFFILVFFFAAFIVVVTNLIAGVDLTSNTPGVAQAAALPDVPVSQPQEIAIQESLATTNQCIALVPVTGGCTNPYTVQSGDSLSQIAVNCHTTLAAIRQANLQIINANLIYPGQLVNIPIGNIVQLPVTGKEEATPVAYLPLIYACEQAPIPVTGLIPILIPGSLLHVQGNNFQPNTPVDVAIGPINTAYTVLTRGVTDANGSLTTTITVPTGSNSQTLWVVVVSTTTQPSVQGMSRTFYIDS